MLSVITKDRSCVNVKVLFISVTPQKNYEWTSCSCHVYKYYAEGKLGSISLKQEASEHIYLPPRSGVKRSGGCILHTYQLFNTDQCSNIKMSFWNVTEINMIYIRTATALRINHFSSTYDVSREMVSARSCWNVYIENYWHWWCYIHNYIYKEMGYWIVYC